jgi:hypothetical protein
MRGADMVALFHVCDTQVMVWKQEAEFVHFKFCGFWFGNRGKAADCEQQSPLLPTAG